MHLTTFLTILLLIIGLTVNTFSQDVILFSQADVDTFNLNTTIINGDLRLGSGSNQGGATSDIDDLSNLANLTTINGDLRIDYCVNLEHVDVLSNLNFIGGDLIVRRNDALLNLNGFSNIISVGNSMKIEECGALLSLGGFQDFPTIGNSLEIISCDVLTNIDVLSDLTSLEGTFRVFRCNALLDVDALSNLNFIGEDLIINYADGLTNLNGLSNLLTIGNSLEIKNCDGLLNLDGFQNLPSIGNTIAILACNSLTNVDILSSITSFEGTIWISNYGSLADLSGLSNLNSIEGNLKISCKSVTNLNPLINLTTVGGELWIACDSILNLDGLQNVDTIGGDIRLRDCYLLQNMQALSNLESIGGGISFESCYSLTSITHMPNITSISGLNIFDSALYNVDSLYNLTSITGDIYMEYNYGLNNLNGLHNVTEVTGNITVYNNSLSDCCGIGQLLSLGIGWVCCNSNGCNSNEEVLADTDCYWGPNLIEGNVSLDINNDCLVGIEDNPLGGIVIEVVDFDHRYTTVTDSLGNYRFNLDTGFYEVRSFVNNVYSEPCIESFQVDLLNVVTNDSVRIDFPHQINTYCPSLEVDVSSWVLRECFATNTYYIDYNNSGTIEAEDAYIELELDTVLSITSASIPFTGPDGNNIYTFDIGDLSIGEDGSFNINIELSCESGLAGQYLGYTFCVDAHIYPDSICEPPSAIWDGSSIKLTSECTSDSIYFTIHNDGEGDMLFPREFTIIENLVISYQGDYQLLGGEKTTLSYFANGNTFRLETEQAEGHPGNGNPSESVEACETSNPVSLGFINQFPQDDEDSFVSIECREVTGSYDPNDKQAFPIGYGEEHFIEKNTDIEYLIRFQNTGTDTAFTVVIKDEISPLLDLTTISPGASSHPYTFQMTDSLVEFIFNDILLVDSLTNEEESHGFVKFRISQQSDLPNGTIIENTADIYFDFNAPIITNTTFHTIGEDFITINLVSGAGVEDLFGLRSAKAYPNPFFDVITFELDGIFEKITLSVYDVMGREVARETYTSTQFQFKRENLNDGVYFFKLFSKGIDVASGKMMME